MTAALPCLASFVNDVLAPRHGSTAATGPPDAHSTAEAITPETIADLKSALSAIPADDYDVWIRIGLALAALGMAGRALFLAWSATSSKFDAHEAAEKWNGFTPNRTGYRAVFSEAKRHGWKNPRRPYWADMPLLDLSLITCKGKPLNQFSREGDEVLPSWPHGTGSADRDKYRFKLLNGTALAALASVIWRVRDIFPAQGVASIYGPSGSGKSFLAFDLGAAIAEGHHWFDCRVKITPVVYVCLEGESGVKGRAAAWENAKGRPLPLGLSVVLQSFGLTTSRDVQDLAAAVRAAGGGAVVIIDTLNRAAPNADENNSKDMGAILSGAKELQRLIGGLVILVHHVGKDAQKGLRGHSSLLAAMDATIEVTRDGDRRSWQVAKSKDGQDGESHPFRLNVVDLGEDEDGEPVTSCVVIPEIRSGGTGKDKAPSGGNQKIAWDAIRPMFASGETGVAGVPTQGPCITHEAAVRAVGPRLTCPPERRNERAKAAIDGLIARKLLGYWDGYLWQA
jgi:putative DNA primase/helicase